MDFVLSVAGIGYDLYFGIFSLLTLSLDELLTLVPVGDIVTFYEFLNPFTGAVTTFSLSKNVWAVLESFISLAFAPAMGISSQPLWVCLSLCVPVYVLLGFVVKTIVSVLS